MKTLGETLSWLIVMMVVWAIFDSDSLVHFVARIANATNGVSS